MKIAQAVRRKMFKVNLKEHLQEIERTQYTCMECGGKHYGLQECPTTRKNEHN